MPPLFLAQVDEVIRQVDVASTKGDRWLFIAALVILLLFVGCVIRWLVTYIQQKDARIESKEKENEIKQAGFWEEAKRERKEDQAEFLKSLHELAAQTEAIKALTKVVVDHDTDMRAAHSVELGTMIEAALNRREDKLHKRP